MCEKLLYALTRPILFSMDPENAHTLTMKSLRAAQSMGLTGLISKPKPDPHTVMGITFPNPVGLAAGLDKDGTYMDGVAAMGFGSLEIGTVTPRPQPGNPRPRMFRISESQALINRMGFNNAGVDALVGNVKKSRFYLEKKGVLGLNIGKNADTPIDKANEDYLICLRKVYSLADYVAVNISSPNTKDLRQLQGENELDMLLKALKVEQEILANQHNKYIPIAVKIAPDIDEDQIKNIARALVEHKMDGVIATNTTITRDAVKQSPHASQMGGLSGAPVTGMSTDVIRTLKQELNGALPIIGVGGIMTGDDAVEKKDAGADLVQLYTGLIYRGPALVRECADALRNKK